MITVLIDSDIPYIKGVLEPIANVIYIKGDQITATKIKHIDALIIRTRTLCNKDLLEGSNVKFIATATIGTDHIDTSFCESHGIKWINVPGCNANSVKQYILSSLLYYSAMYKKDLKKLTLGIIGVGNVGTKIREIGDLIGMRVLLNDPPREEKEKSNQFCSLEKIQKEANIITFHTPLTKIGRFSTFHLANKSFFEGLKQKPLIINSSRGSVINNESLLQAINNQKVSATILDVWEKEPHPSVDLVEKAFIATPHIAGYSADGKANASRQVVKEFCLFFGTTDPISKIEAPSIKENTIRYHSLEEAIWFTYHPLYDSTNLKKELSKFEWFRGNYPLRREAKAYKIIGKNIKNRAFLKKIGFTIEI